MILTVQRFVFPAAFALLPGVMDTPEARALLLAIGLQESRFAHRSQVGGPAHGFWQFEKGGGTKGVLEHSASRAFALIVCTELLYTPDPATVYDAVVDNDVLACCMARLLLWTLPGTLAPRGQAERGWQQYLDAWRPGRPRHETWPEYFATAWDLVAA